MSSNRNETDNGSDIFQIALALKCLSTSMKLTLKLNFETNFKTLTPKLN